MWAAGAPAGAVPAWAARIAYGERFGVEPHKVDPPYMWVLRLGAWDQAVADKAAREAVERYGASEVDEATRRRYNDLILEAKGISPKGRPHG